MRREGRQHGMVRVVYVLPPPLNRKPMGAKVINQFESPPTAGMFTRVPSKPTSHSKFTGKCKRARCAGCHEHPVSKSKDKAKGTNKMRTPNGEFDPIYGGSTAAEMLANLSEEYEGDFDVEIEDDDHVGLHQAEIEESSTNSAAGEMVSGSVSIEVEDGWIHHVMEFEEWSLVD